MLKKIGKGIKNFVIEKIEACKEIFSCNRNRVIIGIIMVGTGLGLITSGYVRVSN